MLVRCVQTSEKFSLPMCFYYSSCRLHYFHGVKLECLCSKFFLDETEIKENKNICKNIGDTIQL